MATELIVNASLPETRIALMENGEIQEILIQTIPYVGFPKIAEAMTATIEVLRERGLDGGVKTAQDNKIL